ncbi:MAG: DUF2804 domain-containing protein [Candidatus Hermodarchaeota archaeon]
MSNQITEPSNLFDENGILIQDGWATKPLLRYNRDKVKASWFRLKEWDNYVVNHPDYNFSVTIADVGYMGLITFELIEYKKKEINSGGLTKFFTKGSLNLPTSSLQGSIEFHNDLFDLKIERLSDKRIISFNYTTFAEKGIKGDLTLFQDPNKDIITKVNRYKKEKRFYYSDKIVWMPVEGQVILGDEIYDFNSNGCYARLDWGRGVWPYKINWYWGAAAGKTSDGHDIWFSQGHSYEDPALHDKNMVGYDGKGHKLGPIRFHVPENPEDLWRFTSEDGRFEMTLKPIFYHPSKMNYIIFNSKSTLVYGLYSGYVILDDGSKIEVEKILGHAESIKWKW